MVLQFVYSNSGTMKAHEFSPESLMMTHGYRPDWSEGSAKPPIFQTSTFVFETAEEGKAFFELAYGLREKEAAEAEGLIYSRLNNPNLELVEGRLCLWDKAEDAAVFGSGMAALSSVLLEFLRPGDLLMYSMPLYGGSVHFIQEMLGRIGVEAIGFDAGEDAEGLVSLIEGSGFADRLAMIYVETPANPTNALVDIEACRKAADHFRTADKEILVAVDNTYMGPLWSHPLGLGADLVMYSATKYIGGHSDLLAGVVLGSKSLIGRVKGLRTFLGNMASPHTCWLLARSLETLKLRMDQQTKNAQEVAAYLEQHPQVGKVHFLGLLEPGTRAHEVYVRQYSSPGAMISFEVGGEAAAFQFLNSLRLFKLAVSLGGTEGLAQHPASMTHAGMDPEEKEKYGISPGLVRLSIGVERIEDILWDLEQAFKKCDPNLLGVEPGLAHSRG